MKTVLALVFASQIRAYLRHFSPRRDLAENGCFSVSFAVSKSKSHSFEHLRFLRRFCFCFPIPKKTAPVAARFAPPHHDFMQDEIDLELKRLTEIFGRDEADEDGQIETDAEFWQQVEIWQRDEAENEPARLEAEARAARELDEWLGGLLAESEPADSGAPEELPDGEIDRLLTLYGEPADSSATDGEISAKLLQEIADWQCADEAAQIEADARAITELDELLERFRDE